VTDLGLTQQPYLAVLWAVREQRIATLARLVENGANINAYLASNSISSSVDRYHWVAELIISTVPGAGNIQLLEEQPEHVASLADGWFFAPLALAAREGLTEVAAWLLDHGAHVDAVSIGLCNDKNDKQYTCRGMWQTPWAFTIWGPNTFYEGPTSRWTALHLAICHGSMDMVKLLVSRGANALQVCGPSAGPCTALHSAVIHRRYTIAEHVLESDLVNINAQGFGGITVLHLAYCLQDSSLLQMAFRHRACLNKEYSYDGNNWTLLAMAFAKNDMFFALQLLRMGANPDFTLWSSTGSPCSASTILQSHRDRNEVTPLFSILGPNGNNQSIQAVEDEIQRIRQRQSLLMLDHQVQQEE
jgi:ankyrin repeat protein